MPYLPHLLTLIGVWVVVTITPGPDFAVSNPKLAAFFSSLFAALLPANLPFWVQGTVVVVMLAVTTAWLFIVVCVSSLGPVVRFYRRVKRWLAWDVLYTGTCLHVF